MVNTYRCIQTYLLHLTYTITLTHAHTLATAPHRTASHHLASPGLASSRLACTRIRTGLAYRGQPEYLMVIEDYVQVTPSRGQVWNEFRRQKLRCALQPTASDLWWDPTDSRMAG